MLRSIKDLIGYPVVAIDGKAGKVVDVLFGDRHWSMRYLDVETRIGFHFNLRYLSEESDDQVVTRVLVEPSMLEQPKLGLDRRRIPTRISRDSMKSCPSFASARPVEEKYDFEFRRFFRHAIYDDRPAVAPPPGLPGYVPPVSAYEHTDEEISEHLKRMKEISGEHVHSSKAVIGYRVRNENLNLGYVADMILDTEKWRLAYIVLDTRQGIPSKKYLVSMDEVIDINWSEVAVKIKIAKEDLVDTRRYWPYDPVNKDNGHDYDYHGKPCLKELMGEYY